MRQREIDLEELACATGRLASPDLQGRPAPEVLNWLDEVYSQYGGFITYLESTPLNINCIPPLQHLHWCLTEPLGSPPWPGCHIKVTIAVNLQLVSPVNMSWSSFHVSLYRMTAHAARRHHPLFNHSPTDGHALYFLFPVTSKDAETVSWYRSAFWWTNACVLPRDGRDMWMSQIMGRGGCWKLFIEVGNLPSKATLVF